MTNDAVLISKNVPLTARLTGCEIWVSRQGEITIFADQFGPQQTIPNLSLEYLEYLCTAFYFGGVARQNAIADILLLNGLLTRRQYDDFYHKLQKNLNNKNYTVIYLKFQ